MTEVANIYPVDIKRQMISQKDRSVIATISDAAFSVCRTQINPNYIRRSLASMTGGIVYVQGSDIISFCIWSINTNLSINMDENPELFIWLVCSKKQSYSAIDMIIFDVERYCRDKGIPCISLEPANDELREYYRSKGFVNGNGANPKRMYRPVATTNVYRRRNTTRKRTSAPILNGAP